MKLLWKPNLWATFLAWVLLSTQAICHAQTANQGSLALTGAISITTCVLDMGTPGSTASGVRTLAFGSIPTSKMPRFPWNGSFVPDQTVIFSVKNADGTTCAGMGTGKWDVGISIPDSHSLVTDNGVSVLLAGDSNSVNATFTKELGFHFKADKNVTKATNQVNFKTNKKYTPPGSGTAYTLLSDDQATAPGLSATDTLALTVFGTTTSFLNTTNGAQPGAFSASVPLTVFYQ